MDLGSVGPVIDGKNNYPQASPPDCLKLLNMHQEATVAIKQHDRRFWLCRRDAHGEADPVADGTEFPDCQEMRVRS